MKQTYSNIEIEYHEDDNCWHFELRGRKRRADSLTKAKEAIDKEPAEKRTQVFPRFEAYRFHYSRGAEIVTVTSIANEDHGYGLQFWVQGTDKTRAKERASSLYPCNPHNSQLIAGMVEIDKQIEALEKQKGALAEQLQHATIPEVIK